MVDKAKAGKLKCIIGSGQNMMEFTYVENVAQAHIQVTLGLSAVWLHILPVIVRHIAGTGSCTCYLLIPTECEYHI